VLRLSLAEREEISRGLAAGEPLREWLRRRWPSLFAGAVVVKCELAAREGSAR